MNFFHKDIFESHKDAIISNWTILQSYEIQQTYNILHVVLSQLVRFDILMLCKGE